MQNTAFANFFSYLHVPPKMLLLIYGIGTKIPITIPIK